MSDLLTNFLIGFAIGAAGAILVYYAYQAVKHFQEESKVINAMKEKQTKLNVIRRKRGEKSEQD